MLLIKIFLIYLLYTINTFYNENRFKPHYCIG